MTKNVDFARDGYYYDHWDINTRCLSAQDRPRRSAVKKHA